MKKLLYFGCIRDTGHYLWTDNGAWIANTSSLRRLAGIEGVTERFFNSLDGTYVPYVTNQGVYKVSQVPPFLIVAWNDYTVDKRMGSHSTFLGIGYASAVDLLADAVAKFPSVMERQKAKLRPEVIEQSSNQG